MTGNILDTYIFHIKHFAYKINISSNNFSHKITVKEPYFLPELF